MNTACDHFDVVMSDQYFSEVVILQQVFDLGISMIHPAGFGCWPNGMVFGVSLASFHRDCIIYLHQNPFPQ